MRLSKKKEQVKIHKMAAAADDGLVSPSSSTSVNNFQDGHVPGLGMALQGGSSYHQGTHSLFGETNSTKGMTSKSPYLSVEWMPTRMCVRD